MAITHHRFMTRFARRAGDLSCARGVVASCARVTPASIDRGDVERARENDARLSRRSVSLVSRDVERTRDARTDLRGMYEPSILCKSLQYSCDACGDLPILGLRWVCERCEDYDLCDSCHSRQHKRSHARMGRGESDSSEETSSSEDGDDGAHDATHEMRSFVVEDTLMPMTRGKLKDVVSDAASRWYIETLRLAKSGDANAAALAAQMLRAGYGCNADSEEAMYWQQVARSAGARRIEGVYDELP